MLDNPEKTRELLTALKTALPFEVELTPEVIHSLRTDDPTVVVEPKQIVSEVSYTGDEGAVVPSSSKGKGNAIIISLTHVRMNRKQPLAKAVFDYQKHRVKKIKKQNSI